MYVLLFSRRNLNINRWIFFSVVAQADLENARNFLSKAAEQNLVCSNRFFSKTFFVLFLFQPELLKQLSDILIAAANNPTARAQAGKSID